MDSSLLDSFIEIFLYFTNQHTANWFHNKRSLLNSTIQISGPMRSALNQFQSQLALAKDEENKTIKNDHNKH